MRTSPVRCHLSREPLARSDELAWRIAEVSGDRAAVDADVAAMIVNRVIDTAAVSAAALHRRPVVIARNQALAHPRPGGATVLGMPDHVRTDVEWAAWANATAGRELDFHDTFLAAEYAHPADSIPPLIAVAQQCGRGGADLVSAIATAYEIHVALARSICLHEHRIDHIAHLAPAVAAGIGTLLRLDVETIYQAVQQAAHVSCTTRQSRKAAISSWKAFAPAHAGKLAIEAVDRAMRGGTSPSPVYEGEDGIVARLLGGPSIVYQVPLPEPGEAKRAVMDTYPKQHSAEYQCQAMIDLAFSMRERIDSWDDVAQITVHTSHHTHTVIGTGSGDPQKLDPLASRETLDHSLMYVLAVALQDGRWHHEASFLPERTRRPDTVRLWHKIRTVEDPEWTRRYHADHPQSQAFGGRVEIVRGDGSKVVDELALPHAHPYGAHPFDRADYLDKFERLSAEFIPAGEQSRFLECARRLPTLAADDIGDLNIRAHPERLRSQTPPSQGLF